MNKKGAEGVVWLVVIIAALLIFLLVYSGIFTKLLGRSVSGIDDKIGSAKDADNDDVLNLADKCPCKYGSLENEGCPIGYAPTDNEDRTCLAK